MLGDDKLNSGITYSFANTPLNAAQAPLATAKNIQCFLHEEGSSTSILSAVAEVLLSVWEESWRCWAAGEVGGLVRRLRVSMRNECYVGAVDFAYVIWCLNREALFRKGISGVSMRVPKWQFSKDASIARLASTAEALTLSKARQDSGNLNVLVSLLLCCHRRAVDKISGTGTES